MPWMDFHKSQSSCGDESLGYRVYGLGFWGSGIKRAAPHLLRGRIPKPESLDPKPQSLNPK